MSSDNDHSDSSGNSRALAHVPYVPLKLRPSDHAIIAGKAAVSAALSLLGPVGAAVTNLVNDYAPSVAQQSNERTFTFLYEQVARIQERIKPDAINRDEFADLFKRFEDVTAKTNRDEKLRAAAKIVANSLLPPDDPSRSTYEELDYLMHCVDTLSIGAIALLCTAIQRHPRRGDVVLRFPELRQRDQNPDLAFGLASELRALSLMHISEGPINVGEYENYQFRVTQMGYRFYDLFLKLTPGMRDDTGTTSRT